MKKLLLLVSYVGISGLVHASTTITAPSSLIGTETLDGNDAYAWGVSIAVPTGEQITSAEIDFTSVTLNIANSSGVGYLYTDILNSQTKGLTTAVDNDATGDYWATKYSGANISSFGYEYYKQTNLSYSWDDVFDTAQLASLNSYLTAGTFNIGIDPDCHYSVGGISFTYTLSPISHNTVPDAATTALLLALGLAGLEVFRRQFVTAKMKA